MKKYPLVKQDDLKDCGAASLATILKYYKGNIPIEKMKEITFTNKNGTTAYHIVEAAKKLGFESYGLKCNIDEIKEKNIPLPVIAHTVINNQYKHFIVLYEIDNDKKTLIIGDPMNKVKKISFKEFSTIFQNVVIVSFPIKILPNEKNTNKLTKEFKEIVFKQKKLLFQIIIFSLLYIIYHFISILFLNSILKGYELYKSIPIYISLIILKISTEFIKNKVVIKFENKINFELTKSIFFRIITLPYTFYRNKTTGEVISRFNDIQKIIPSSLYILIQLPIDIILILISTVILLIIEKTLFIFTMFIVLNYFLIYKIFYKLENRQLETLKTEQDLVQSNIIESITGFESIKGLNLEEEYNNKFKKIYEKYLKSIIKLKKQYNFKSYLKDFIYQTGLILTVVIGIIFIKNEKLTFEYLIIYYIIFQTFFEVANKIFENENTFKEIKLSFKRLENLYYYEYDKYNVENIKSISFKNVTYEINGVKDILKNVNFEIKNKDKIILIGESGSGKSTILKLIKKYYKNNNVYLNNGVLEKNKNIIYISQNEFLFTDTLYNNILLNRNFTNEEVKKVIDICFIDNIIKDKNLGYNMLIEENGFNISGGERQRIILARALLGNADVIMMDESLSEVDGNLERKILKNVFKYYHDKIIIFVSHKKCNLDLFNQLWKCHDKKLEVIKKEG